MAAIIGSIPNDLHDAALAYRKSTRWALIPLHGPNQGELAERGKKPLLNYSKGWTHESLTEKDIDRYFRDSNYNLGRIVGPNEVVIDVDAKPSKGQKARDWLCSSKKLQDFPRERTWSGYHFHFGVDGVPDIGKQSFACDLADGVKSDVYFANNNVVLAPSRHPSGVTYQWEKTGAIPHLPWSTLVSLFGLVVPQKVDRKGSNNWFDEYDGDLSTLDVQALASALGILGEPLPKGGGSCVRCPWHENHNGGKGESGWKTSDGSSVILLPGKDSRFPSFRCLHTGCSDKTLEHFLKHASQLGFKPDTFCKRQRKWFPGALMPDGRPTIPLPGHGGQTAGRLAAEVAELIGRSGSIFQRSHNLVEVVGTPASPEGFRAIRPAGLITRLERYAATGILKSYSRGKQEFVETNIGEPTAKVILSAPEIGTKVPEVRHIIPAPIPFLIDDELVWPNEGFDPRLGTFLPKSAPAVQEPSFEEACRIVSEIYSEFAIPADEHGQQSRAHAVSHLLTPFCLGLINFARTPLFVYTCNRERVGKDYMAMIPQVVFQAKTESHPPIKDDAEWRKRIMTCIAGGSSFLHTENFRGHLDSSSLEAALTAPYISDRLLGHNESIGGANAVIYSLSGNEPFTWTPDIEKRKRIIRLFFPGEEPNLRTFNHPDLHGMLRRNRPKILGALSVLVKKWFEMGRPKGSTFASYPAWAEVVGGICKHVVGLDPCLPERPREVGGDEKTASMRELFKVGLAESGKVPDGWLDKVCLLALAGELVESGLFAFLGGGLDERRAKTNLARTLETFVGRELSGIRMEATGSKNARVFRFIQVETTRPEAASRPWEIGRYFADFGNRGGGGGTPDLLSPLQHPSPLSLRCPKISPNLPLTEEKAVGDVLENLPISQKTGLSRPQPSTPPARFEVIVDPGAFNTLAGQVRQAGRVGLDIETYGPDDRGCLSPFSPGAAIRLVSIKLPGHDPRLIDLKRTGTDLGELGAALGEVEVIAHNAKFEALWLRRVCGLKLNRVFCTCTAERILTAGNKVGRVLEDLVQRHLGVTLSKGQARSSWGSLILTDAQLAYAASDVEHLPELRDALEARLDDLGLTHIFRIESDLLGAVVEMELAGFPVDRGMLADFASRSRELAAQSAARLKEVLGDINPNSPKQLLTAFASIGVSLKDTSSDTLAQTNHPAAKALQSYRETSKAAEGAVSLLQAVALDGRIHASFNPLGADTGRFSCSKPNLQQVGRNGIRKAFRATEGRRLIIADYSQIELRIAAVVAGDERMTGAYHSGSDLHQATASIITGKPTSQIGPTDRQTAKAVNFGLLYGQQPRGLVEYARNNYGVELSLLDAQRFRERFFRAYPALAAWHREAMIKAQAAAGTGLEAHTLLGRPRKLPPGNSWPIFTGLLNHPVQGTAAEGLKKAMIRLARELPDGSAIVATVHDELVIEAPEDHSGEVRELTERIMREEMEKILEGKVPVLVEAKVAGNWGDK